MAPRISFRDRLGRSKRSRGIILVHFGSFGFLLAPKSRIWGIFLIELLIAKLALIWMGFRMPKRVRNRSGENMNNLCFPKESSFFLTFDGVCFGLEIDDKDIVRNGARFWIAFQ